MRSYQFVLFILITTTLSFSGCIDEDFFDDSEAETGDLILILTMDRTEFENAPESMILNITLENVCSRDLEVEDLFSFGSTLFPEIYLENVSEVRLGYFLLDYSPTYSVFKPGEKKFKQVDLAAFDSKIVINETSIDFQWDISGTYSIRIGYWGAGIEVWSNELIITIL